MHLVLNFNQNPQSWKSWFHSAGWIGGRSLKISQFFFPRTSPQFIQCYETLENYFPSRFPGRRVLVKIQEPRSITNIVAAPFGLWHEWRVGCGRESLIQSKLKSVQNFRFHQATWSLRQLKPKLSHMPQGTHTNTSGKTPWNWWRCWW